jgi:transposase
MLRRSVCEHYGASSATLSLWVQRYNAAGLAGLEDKPRPGAPCKKLEVKQQATFRERLIKQPDAGKDGLVRWRVRDVQKVLQEEFRLPVTVNKG